MANFNYKELLVWQKAMDLAEEIYKLTASIPKTESIGIISQLRRAAVSIPSNIAEGQMRQTTKEYINFLCIARGSNAEVETQLLLCSRIGYLSEEKTEKALSLTTEIVKMLNALISKLNSVSSKS
ncbi:MAG: four helix bundle protein [Clostridia bacterium]|nr:four helix bundle protein [Clostridia bacterium]